MSNLKLVAWSGGCDSTLALYEALRNQKTWVVEGEQRYEVRALSINFSPVPQNAPQRAVRKRIKAALALRGLHFAHIELDLVANNNAFSDRASQAVCWLAQAQQYLCTGEDLVTGWIRGDDVWHNIADLRASFTSLNAACGRANSALETPLEWITKATVIKRLKAADLYDLTWWCENPRRVGRRFEQCKSNCVPCRTHATALWQQKTFGPVLEDEGR